jgi:ABC-type multidrug transport system ATPase subunit
VEVRDLLRRLAAAGKTVFISSHILAEVQQICDRVGIVNLGELVRVATVSELLAGRGDFVLRIQDAALALDLVSRQEWGAGALLEDGLLVSPSPSGRGRDLVLFLAQAGYWPETIEDRTQNLEEIFLDLTGTSRASVREVAS